MNALRFGEHAFSRVSRRLALSLAVLLLAAGAAVAQQASTPQLYLRYGTFDPLRNQPQVAAGMRFQAKQLDEVGQFLLQFQGPVRPEWLKAVRSFGVVLDDYVPDYAFVARMTVRQAAALPVRYRFVRWVGAFHPAYKVDPKLSVAQQGVATVVAVDGVNTQTLAKQIAALGAPVLKTTADSVQVKSTPAVAAQLARLPSVKWVTVLPPLKLANDRAATIMGVPTSSGGVRVKGLYGQGQIVCVADTGLDTGNPNTLNADFQGRLVKGIGIANAKDWSDPEGHGTHVAGSVLGAGVNSGSDPSRHSYDGSFAGVAPEASLVMQSIGSGPLGDLYVPNDLRDLFAEPYALGARVHTNSWGAENTGLYTIRANEVDQFVYDHPDMVILFAAGNEGRDADKDGIVDARSISDPAAAKNIICVGASENYRPPQEKWGGYSQYAWGDFLQVINTNPITYAPVYPTEPLTSDAVSNDVNGMAAFSSRGPASDGRIKPDLVAPGTDIVSVWSRPASQPYTLGKTVIPPRTGWGEFDGDYSDARPTSKYMYNGGTSMATPLTAGAATLVRQYFAQQKWNASAALVKAMLINGAREMSPGQYGAGIGQEMTSRPNGVEGWGRVDLANALYPPSPRKVVWFEGAKLQTDEYHHLVYRVKGAGEPLRFTLVWTDPPAAPYVSKALVNNLNLHVTDPSGNEYWGNGIVSGDSTNNVEQIEIDAPTVGDYDVRIEGANVPEGPQSYALVISANGEPKGGRFPDIVPPQVRILSPVSGSSVAGPVRIEVAANDDRAVSKVTLWLTDTKGQKVYLGARYAAPYVFNWNTAGWKRGQYAFEATAMDFGRNTATDSISLTVGGAR